MITPPHWNYDAIPSVLVSELLFPQPSSSSFSSSYTLTLSRAHSVYIIFALRFTRLLALSSLYFISQNMPHSFYHAQDMDDSLSPLELPSAFGFLEAELDNEIAAHMFNEYIMEECLDEDCGVDFSDRSGQRLPGSFSSWVPSPAASTPSIRPTFMTNNTFMVIDPSLVNDPPMAIDVLMANDTSSTERSDAAPSSSSACEPKSTPPTPPTPSPRTPIDEPDIGPIPPAIVTDPSTAFPALAAEPIPITYNMAMYHHMYGRPLYQHMPPQFIPAGPANTPNGMPVPQHYPAHVMTVSFGPMGPIFRRYPTYQMGAAPLPQCAVPPVFQPALQPALQPAIQPQCHPTAPPELVSNKRAFEFVEPTVPGNAFAANPDNHGRFEYDRAGNRKYLNAPKVKRPCTN